MRNRCSRTDCPAPKGLCVEHASPEYFKCEHWLGDKPEQSVEKPKTGNKKAKSLPWTGEPFQPADIEIVSQRSAPLIVGMVGGANAGKTSYLGMLYTLLFNGKKLQYWQFAGSYTLAAWEMLAQYLKIRTDGSVEFAPPTPSNPDFYSLFHIALKRGELFRDVLFADSSGEVFKDWSVDVHNPNAENALWIYEKSSAFIFMVDSVALAERRGAAKAETVQIAEQIAANLNDRPVAVVWAKADKIENVRSNIRNALEEDLAQIFGYSQVFKVSNFFKSDPDVLCHKNNLAVMEFLLEKLNKPQLIKLIPQVGISDDLFFNYRGSHGDE